MGAPKRSHCKRGHALTPDNLLCDGRGHRGRCRLCHQIRQQGYRERARMEHLVSGRPTAPRRHTAPGDARDAVGELGCDLLGAYTGLPLPPMRCTCPVLTLALPYAQRSKVKCAACVAWGKEVFHGME